MKMPKISKTRWLVLLPIMVFIFLTSGMALAATTTTNSAFPLCPEGQIEPATKPCRCPPSKDGSEKPDCLGYITPTGEDCANDSGSDCLKKQSFITKDVQPVVDTLSALVIIVIIGNIIYGGIQYAMAGDKPETMGAAKKRITTSLVALLIFILLVAFVQYLIPGGIFK